MTPKKLLRSLLRHDLSCFIHKVFCTVNPGSTYQPNWHIRLIADYLQAVQSGKIKRLIINIPPRSLKSICVSVAWPAWMLGCDPSKRIMAASYSHTLSLKHSLDCRLVISSPWYKHLFPSTILSTKHNQKSKFLTTLNGFRFATSVGGSATGEGGDFLIIDDPHNPMQINSPKMRQRVIEWFEQTFLTRLNDKSNGAVVLVMQRLHEEDLAGHLLSANDHWQLLKLPVRADKTYIIPRPHIPEKFSSTIAKEYKFCIGQLLHPLRDQEDYLIKLEQEIGSYNFAAQYMQEPIANYCSLLRMSDISFYETLPGKFDYLIQSWDTAIKLSEQADYSVCTVWGITENKYYLIAMFRNKLSYPELKKKAEELARQYPSKFLLIEDKSSGQQLIQDLQLNGYNNIEAIKPKLDKITRFASVAPLFQAAKALIPKQSPFTTALLKELTTFPLSRNDDIVDSVSQFLQFAKLISHKPLARIREL